jgi:hypothetical protein
LPDGVVLSGPLDEREPANGLAQDLEVCNIHQKHSFASFNHQLTVVWLVRRIEESGAIVIAMIPADDRDWSDLRSPVNSELQRVDCILGGWVLTPTPNEETCTVTWLMQANFGACDPRAEFTGMHGLRSVVARRVLLSWADEVSSLLAALEDSYDPEHYRRLGPLLSSSAFQKLRIDQPEATVNALQDPRVYAIACELEPCLCLLVHKSSNRNVLVFKANLSASVRSRTFECVAVGVSVLGD